MPELPTGTITFLFSDIEGSSRKWEEHPEAMRVALGIHDRLLRAAFESAGGHIFKTIGDAFCVAFDTAQDALAGALESQRALRRTQWDGIGELKVRMALHTGVAEHRDADYFGPSLNRVSRILAAAHGGQVLLSLPTEELVRDVLPPNAQLRHLGEHRLRDLARPEHLFQLLASDLPSEFPALRSLESVPNNLPIQLSTFIGREREMAEVKRLLASTRLLTLTGMGGTGKTRLSLQVAADILDSFRDGVWLVEFATIDDASLVVETVAAALEIRQEADRPLASTLTNFLRTRNLLLIFDNCEHVVGPCARLAETLLRACPQLKLLASSREPLGIAGETAWPLPPLSLPEHWREITAGPDALERLMQYEAVRLFVDRATIVRPAFHLTDENVHLVAQICWRLDGIALAIELAAARIRVLTLQQIVERLDDRFHLLTTGSRTAVPRQQTLRSLIDWSHDLLSEPERMLLRRLSVFARGRTLEAIEAVCAGEGIVQWDLVDLLTQLVDKSLVYVEKEPDTGARYFMLESIWDYAQEKLIEAGERSTFRERHLDYFLEYAESSESKLLGPQQVKWLHRMEVDDMNLRYAVETSEEVPHLIEKGLRILTATHRFVEVRGRFKETRVVFARLLAHPDAAPPTATRARALSAAIRLAWVNDDYNTWTILQEEAMALYQKLNDARGIAFTLVSYGARALENHKLEEAKAFLQQASELAKPINDLRLNAHLCHTCGLLNASLGDPEQALALARESLAIYQNIGDIWMSLISGWVVGMGATLLGRFEEARAQFTDVLTKQIELENRWGLPYPIEAFATLAVAEGKYEHAGRLFGAAESLRARNGISKERADHPALRNVLAAAEEEMASPAVRAAHLAGNQLAAEAAIKLALQPVAPALAG